MRTGNATRSRSRRSTGEMFVRNSSRSSSTITCSGIPICGAASPTPGAARIVAIITRASSRISGLAMRSSGTSAAAPRRTGSPVCTIGAALMTRTRIRRLGRNFWARAFSPFECSPRRWSRRAKTRRTSYPRSPRLLPSSAPRRVSFAILGIGGLLSRGRARRLATDTDDHDGGRRRHHR